MTKRPTKAILFDVGGTLIDVNPSVGHVYSQVAHRYKIKADPGVLNKRFLQCWKKFQKPDHLINKSWWKILVSDVFRVYESPLKNQMFNDVYNAFTEKKTWKIYPDVKIVLEQLRRKNIRLAVASNWDSRLPNLLKTLGLSEFFDLKFISSEMGIQKPDPRFFKTCLRKLQLSPKDVVHVGDDRINDYVCPRAVGLQALIINRSGQAASKTASIVTLKDLLKRF